MKEDLNYPIQFKAIPKEKIWGGSKLNMILEKDFNGENIGESWEVSDTEDDLSIVKNGSLKGLTLKDLIVKYKDDFLGIANYSYFGDKFPLLIKFIDAADDLSVQVHPNDELAKERHNSFGKTEMWYVMDTDTSSELILGFNQNLSREKYQTVLQNKELEKFLNFEKVKSGDSFFVEAGLIHAIGKGVMIAEIQQTSDLTYRVYDWNRKDDKGNERELHTDLALDALIYDRTESFKIVKKNNNLISNKYFTVNEINIEGKIYRSIQNIDSFIVYMVVDGEVKLEDNYCYKKGQTFLMPANYNKNLKFTGKGKILEIYINWK